MTITQAAEYLGLSRRTVFRLIKRNLLPARKLDNYLWVIKREDVDTYAQTIAGKSKHDPTKYQDED